MYYNGTFHPVLGGTAVAVPPLRRFRRRPPNGVKFCRGRTGAGVGAGAGAGAGAGGFAVTVLVVPPVRVAASVV
jgi:hypothetical protein